MWVVAVELLLEIRNGFEFEFWIVSFLNPDFWLPISFLALPSL